MGCAENLDLTHLPAALRSVNDSEFGLQAGIFTRDLYKAQRVWDELEVGGVVIGDMHPRPFGHRNSNPTPEPDWGTEAPPK